MLVIEAAAHAYRLGSPFTHTLTIHLQGMGVTQPHAFITDFFKLFGDSLRGGYGPACWVWVLETGPGKGLHLHGALHVPPSRWQGLRRRVERWSEQILRSPPPPKAISLRRIDFADKPRSYDYLGKWWKPGTTRCGLKGWLGYMLKGCDPLFAQKIRIQSSPQGRVANRRSSTSQALGGAARKSFRAVLTTPHPRFPRVLLLTEAAIIERVLLYAGFTDATAYQAVEV